MTTASFATLPTSFSNNFLRFRNKQSAVICTLYGTLNMQSPVWILLEANSDQHLEMPNLNQTVEARLSCNIWKKLMLS
uniref:Uncharacterized protein n=1 Tax=Rhizophora mucronata TaxID=61149 RepID=A0A2P2KX71_RHIMU